MTEREEELGRDLMDVGLMPFLTRLVGADNAKRVLEQALWDMDTDELRRMTGCVMGCR